MRPNLRMNFYSSALLCEDSYLTILDTIFAFERNHRFIKTVDFNLSLDDKHLSVIVYFVDNTDFINRTNYVLAFCSNICDRYHNVSHVLNNFSAYSK